MSNSKDSQQTIERVKRAFDADGFDVSERDVVVISGKFGEMVGIKAKSKQHFNYETGEPKLSYYVEGTPYEMGLLMGRLAEEHVSKMAVEFVDQLPFAFVSLEIENKTLAKILAWLVQKITMYWSQNIKDALPASVGEELRGLLDGCLLSNPDTLVTEERLWLLNVGFDAILAHVYTGDFFVEHDVGIEQLRIPLLCNAFSVSGEAAGGKHFFGRDFMFPSADIFQKHACVVVNRPFDEEGKKTYPFVSTTAPGMIGSTAGVNSESVAVGVDVLATAACDPDRPGFCSLLLARHALTYGKNAQEVVDIIADAQRGVSWIYAVADGKDDSSVMIEVTASVNKTDDELIEYIRSFPSDYYHDFLPDDQMLRESFERYKQDTHHQPFKYFQRGLFPRWNDATPHEEFLALNEQLWHRYNQHPLKSHDAKIIPGAFEPFGYLNHYKEENLPSVFYFAPQRKLRDDVNIATNQFLTPEMRYFAMANWVGLLSNGKEVNDFQWRYDELHHQIYEAMGLLDGALLPLTHKKAREVLDFLSPFGAYPDYYDKSPRSSDGKRIAIEGSLSLFELKEQSIECMFGYYGDGWVRLRLPHYLA